MKIIVKYTGEATFWQLKEDTNERTVGIRTAAFSFSSLYTLFPPIRLLSVSPIMPVVPYSFHCDAVLRMRSLILSNFCVLSYRIVARPIRLGLGKMPGVTDGATQNSRRSSKQEFGGLNGNWRQTISSRIRQIPEK